MRIALYQPDIPQNTGTVLRLCACLGIEAHIIEPAGFPTSDRAFRRAGMDYLDAVTIVRHGSWRDFAAWRAAGRHRLVLFTTGGATSYLDYQFAPTDVLLFGRESRACRKRSTTPPTPASSSRCARACARSTSQSPPPWPPARRCGRRVGCLNTRKTDRNDTP